MSLYCTSFQGVLISGAQLIGLVNFFNLCKIFGFSFHFSQLIPMEGGMGAVEGGMEVGEGGMEVGVAS